MIWSIFLSAVGLLFVFEGIMPFIAPFIWRRTMQQIVLQSDRTLRVIGLVSMLVGLVCVSIARDLF